MWFPTAFLPFILTIAVLCFGIGWFALGAFFKNDASGLTPWERFLYSFGLSQSLTIFGMMAIGHAGIHLNVITLSFFLPLLTLLITLLLSLILHFHKEPSLTPNRFQFSTKQALLAVVLILATLLIKHVYLTNTIIPTATDLGHHLYWAKTISESGSLPFYAEQNIVKEEESYQVTEPEPIADFIIGEHLTIAAIATFTGLDYLSAFPVLFLHLINILSLLALATLAYYLSRGVKLSFLKNQPLWSGENVFLATLFVFGPLYALGSPQSKFISGGVVGNTFGNFFIPLILLCFYRALHAKDSRFLSLGLILSWTLAYIHHLSTFILAFILVASILVHLIFHWRHPLTLILSWIRLLLRPLPLALLLLVGGFFFFIAMPTYIETGAVDTAVGTPTRTTRTGLTLEQITNSLGAPRLALALFCLTALLLVTKRTSYARTFLIGWMGILLLMTLRPDLLFVDIPSNRIGAYLSFPIGIGAALALVATLAFLKQYERHMPRLVLVFTIFSLFIFTTINGNTDNTSVLLDESKAESLVATFHATQFLANHTSTDDRIVKDHNFIVGDAWMKLFFMRGYSYPFSRAYFGRYETNPDREHCTLYMISTPSSKDGEKCFTATGVNFVVVNSTQDGAQFNMAKKFSKIYSSRYISIYQKNTSL